MAADRELAGESVELQSIADGAALTSSVSVEAAMRGLRVAAT